jgi:hypothetical protein
MPRSEDKHGKHWHPPPLLRALARRVVRVLLAASPHLPQWIRRTTHHPPQPHEPLLMGWNAGGNNDVCSQRTTHPQPHEPLLVGWNMGGTMVAPAPYNAPPTPASRATARGVEIGGHHCPLLQHPQPLPQAIARGGEGVLCERWCVTGGVFHWNPVE